VDLLAAGADASVEGDVEGVEGGFPAVGPAFAAVAGGVQGHGGQVEALEGGLFGGEVAAGVDGAAVAGVQRFQRVGGGDDGADLPVEEPVAESGFGRFGSALMVGPLKRVS
jgi:hypothetical protein